MRDFIKLPLFIFLILVTIGEDSAKFLRYDKLGAIQTAQILTVGLVNNTNHFFYINNQATGLEYDLMIQLGTYLKVEVETKTFDNITVAHKALDSGDIDIAIAITTLEKPHDTNRYYSKPYLESNLWLVDFGDKHAQSKNDSGSVTLVLLKYANLFEGKTSSTQDKQTQQLRWVYREGSLTDILAELSEGRAESTILDKFEFAIYQLLYPVMKLRAKLPYQVAYRFALVKTGNERLLYAINNYITTMQKQGQIHQLYRRYYSYNQINNRHNADAFLEKMTKELPRLKELFIKVGSEFDIDPYLLAAIAYQESRWNADAVSSTGVKGLMMLTNATAEEVGVTDRTDVEQSLYGGAKYLIKMINKLPERIIFPDRLWFALAAYNMGFGHVEDARLLTQKAGLNPDIWDHVIQYLPKLEDPAWYETTKFGQARGTEAATYVRNIRRFYDVLRHLDKETLLPNE